MSDLDEFLNSQTKPWSVEKQENYEHKALLILLRGLEAKAGMAKRIMEIAGAHFGMVWLMNHCPEFPLRLATYKAHRAIQVQTLLKRPDTLSIYREMTELRDNYGDTHMGLIFASDGDGLPDLIIHTRSDWNADLSHWRIMLVDDRLSGRWVVDPLEGFIETFKSYSSWRLSPELVGALES